MHSEITKNPLRHQDIEIHTDKVDELPPELYNTEPSL